MIELAYCGDVGMLTGLQLSLLSILKVAPEPLDVWVITAENDGGQAITEQQLAKVCAILAERGCRLHLIDISAEFNRCYPVANQDSIFNVNCMLRLYLDLVPGIPDRLLYLDTDVLCRRNFADFYHHELGRSDFAGALDYYGKWVYHHRLNWRMMDYINSGVLLFNMRQVKQDRLLDKCRHFCRYHRTFLPDQEALNRFARHKEIVSHRYNDQHGLHRQTVFQHFTTQLKFLPKFHTLTVKPWEFGRVHTVLGIDDYDALFKDYHRLFDDQEKN